MHYFVSGLRWGKPYENVGPFLDICLRHQVVIVHNTRDYVDYEYGDLLLLISGKKPLGMARIVGDPEVITDRPGLYAEFHPININNDIHLGGVRPSEIMVFPAKVAIPSEEDMAGLRYNHQRAYFPIKMPETIVQLEQLANLYRV